MRIDHKVLLVRGEHVVHEALEMHRGQNCRFAYGQIAKLWKRSEVGFRVSIEDKSVGGRSIGTAGLGVVLAVIEVGRGIVTGAGTHGDYPGRAGATCVPAWDVVGAWLDGHRLGHLQPPKRPQDELPLWQPGP